MTDLLLFLGELTLKCRFRSYSMFSPQSSHVIKIQIMFVFLLPVLNLKHIPFYFPTHSGLWLGLLICVIIQSCFFTTLIFKLNWKKVTEQVGHDKSNMSSQAAIVDGS